MKHKPLVSVVVTTYNRSQQLRVTLRSLLNQDFKNYEIVVVDDGSSDGTENMIDIFLRDPHIPLLYVKQQDLGFRLAAARNLGVRFAQGRLIVFLDDDKVPYSGFLQSHWDAHLRNPFSLAYGQIRYVPEETVSILLAHEDTNESFWKIAVAAAGDDPRLKLEGIPVYELAWGGNTSIPRMLCLAINGLDEDFRAWGGEDLDLANRFFRWGADVVSLEDAVVFHLGSYAYPENDAGQQLYLQEKMEAEGPLREQRNVENEIVTLKANRRSLCPLYQLTPVELFSKFGETEDEVSPR